MKRRIVIMIDRGVLTGVFTDGDPDDIIIDLVDYDNINADDSGEMEIDAATVEEDIRSGKLRSCW